MSKGARITLAIVTLFSAICFCLIGRFLGPELPAGSGPFYGMAAFCAVIAVACLAQSSRPVTLRIIGSAIFLTYAFYVYNNLGERNLFRAVLAFLVWGLPSGYLAIWGEYPAWGRWAVAFRPELGRNRQADRTSDKRR